MESVMGVDGFVRWVGLVGDGLVELVVVLFELCVDCVGFFVFVVFVDYEVFECVVLFVVEFDFFD